MELNDEEKKVIELYRACSNVDFYLHMVTEQEAIDFTSICGKPKFDPITEDVYSYKSTGAPKKCSVTAFLNDLSRDEIKEELSNGIY